MGNKISRKSLGKHFKEGPINSLPDEILAQILELVLNSEDSDNLDLLLVSKRWKDVIEAWHVFKNSTFFEGSRNNEEFSLASNSRRRFEGFRVNYSSSMNSNFYPVLKVLRMNQKTLRKIDINLQLWCKISFRKFYEILESFKDVETLNIQFHCMLIQNTEDFDPPVINFRNLKSLTIGWEFGEQVIGKFMLQYLKAPQLNNFEVNSPYELKEFFSFITRNPGKLEAITITEFGSINFKWDIKFLELFYRPEMLEGLTEFLTSERIHKLEGFKIRWYSDDGHSFDRLMRFKRDSGERNFNVRDCHDSLYLLISSFGRTK